MYKSNKFVAKLQYMIIFKDILTILELDYRDASLKTFKPFFLGIIVPKI